MVLYAATTNPGKLAEFAESASDDGIDVRALPNIAALPEPVEDAATFMGNAEIKAVAYSLASPGLMVFADDSGLEIDALGGAPGVRSARFADDRGFDVPSGAGKDERNNLCVLSLLAGVPAAPRGARFVCALVLARDGKVELRADLPQAGKARRDCCAHLYPRPRERRTRDHPQTAPTEPPEPHPAHRSPTPNHPRTPSTPATPANTPQP